MSADRKKSTVGNFLPDLGLIGDNLRLSFVFLRVWVVRSGFPITAISAITRDFGDFPYLLQ